MEDVMVFANPISGKGKGKRTAERIAEGLTEAGYAARIFFDHADTLENETLHVQSASAAVVIGGDGTLRGVVAKLMQAGRVPPVVFVGMGTANLMSQHLSLNWKDKHLEHEVVEVIESAKIVQLDAASANGKLFLLMAGVGIDAKIVHELEKMRRGPISLVSYALPTAFALSSYRYPPLNVEVDGKPVFQGQPAIAMIGNVREYGTGFCVLPMARADDGLLDICVMPCRSPQDLIPLFLNAAAGELTAQEGVVYLKGKQIKVTSHGPVPVQVDGDAAGFTPLEVEMMETKVPFLVR